MLKSDNKEEIEAKTQALSEASSKMAERLYADQQKAGEQQPGGEQATGANTKKEENVMDAEFEEVKDDGKKD